MEDGTEVPDKTRRSRRTVTLCSPVLTGGIKGGRRKLWACGYPDLARLFGVKENALRKLVSRGRLDPADLAQVIDFFLKFKPRRVRIPKP